MLRVIQALSIVLTVAGISWAALNVRKPSRVRIGFDLARIVISLGAVAAFALITGVQTRIGEGAPAAQQCPQAIRIGFSDAYGVTGAGEPGRSGQADVAGTDDGERTVPQVVVISRRGHRPRR